MDKRWCDSCSTSNLTVKWYYSPELDEVCLCNKCKRSLVTNGVEMQKLYAKAIGEGGPMTYPIRDMSETKVTIMDDVKVIDVDDNVTSDDNVEEEDSEDLPVGLDMSPLDFAAEILSGNWQNGSLEDRQNFVEGFRNLYKACSTLRTKLDAQIWARHEQGKDTPKSLPSIRAPRTGDKPGRKAKVKTTAEILLGK